QEADPLAASVPAPLRWVVERCLAKDPAERYDSTRDLYRELKQVRDRITEISGGTAPQTASSSPRRSRTAVFAIAALVIAAAALLAGRFVWRTPPARPWSGIMLGGSEIALNPRLSPDGHLLAFEAMVDGLSQIAVMKPESGNWSILTHDRSRGPITTHSWSA